MPINDVNETKERIAKKFLIDLKWAQSQDEKIAVYESLIKESDKYNLPAYSECFRGYVKWLKRDYIEAVEHFKKSIKLDARSAFPWNGLGNVYVYLNNHREAIECYKNAIDIDPNFAYSWNGLGYVYDQLENYKEAIECYKKSVDTDESIAYSWFALGYDYGELKEYEAAEAAYLKSLKLYEREKNNFRISLVKEKLKSIQRLLQSQKILTRKKEIKHPDPVTKVLEATIETGIEKIALENKKSFLGFIEEKKDRNTVEKDYFQVLRRWNSYTPIIADNYYISKGGGYFLKAGGKGIVIDPGFNFIDNFKGAGHLFDEIDTVLISHAHNDHTADLESILTLLYKFNDEIKDSSDSDKNTIRKEIAQRKNCRIYDVSSDEIEETFLKSDRRKIIDFYMTNSVFKKFSGLFELSSKKGYKIHIIEKGDVKEINSSVSFDVLAAKHRDIISDTDSVGFTIDLGNSVLIYTGDTGWSEKIEKNYKKIGKKHKAKFKLLVAHLGGVKETEITYLNEEVNKDEAFYANHLGRLGLVKINEVVNPDICFISEFGEELKGFRIKIAKIFQEAFENKILFFPADIGLIFDFKSRTIEAVTSVNLEKYKLTKEEIKPEEIETCLLRKDYSLHYFKKNGNFTEGELIQVLIEEYDQSNR